MDENKYYERRKEWFADECNKEEHEVVDYLYFCRVKYDEEHFFLEIVDKPL